MTEQAVATKREVSMAVVLNGGREEMDSATIPVQWVFSDETISETPTHLLFFEQDESEAGNYHAADRGRRYVCKVSDGVKFIPVFRPGYHRMAVLALAGRFVPQGIERLLSRSMYEYATSISWRDLEESVIPESLSDVVVAATVMEFRVPDELFAEKPRTRFGEAVWKWVNLWEKKPPRDECDYRARKIFAFTLKPIFFLIGAVAYALYVLLASVTVFFFGFRPKNIASEIWQALKLTRPDEWNVCLFITPTYRTWEEDRHGYVTKRMPVTGIELMFLGSGAWLFWSLINSTLDWQVWLLIAISFIVVAYTLAALLSRVYYALPSSLERQRLALEKEKQLNVERQRLFAEKYQQWLRGNFDLSRKPDAVDLSNLPPPPTKTGQVVQRFRVGFWALKARICRPYVR